MTSFNLESDFVPSGDQPKAVEKLINGVKNDLREQTLLGVTGSGKTYSMACVIESINRPTLVIAHRLSTIMNSKKIYVVDEGKIIDQGNHQELLQKSETYKNFYEKQLRKD